MDGKEYCIYLRKSRADMDAEAHGEGETLARLTALFRREGGDWLEVDFTDWGSGAAERENFGLIKRAC